MSLPAVTVLPDSVFLPGNDDGPMPLYFQLAQRLEGAIRDGQLPAGARLENEVDLADRLGLSRPTVRRALEELVNKGLLVRRRGIGTQVLPIQIRRNVALTSLFDDLESTNRRPSQQVLVHELIPASVTVAEQLGVEISKQVLRVRRLRLADTVPLAILENFLPPAFADLSREAFEQHSMYRLLQARGATLAVAHQRIGARQAQSEEARLLELTRHAPLLTMERTVFDNAGRAVEYGTHVYRPDLYTFETTLVGR